MKRFFIGVTVAVLLAASSVAAGVGEERRVFSTGPTVTIVSGPSGWTNDPTPTFELSVSDPTATILCSYVDHGTYHEVEECPSPVALPRPNDGIAQLPEGFHRFNAVAIDASGNQGPHVGRDFRTDSIAPETRLYKTRQTLRPTRTSMYFRSSDGTARLSCSLDREVFSECQSPLALAGLRPGEHTFTVTASDAVGNVDPSPASFSFVAARKKDLNLPGSRSGPRSARR